MKTLALTAAIGSFAAFATPAAALEPATATGLAPSVQTHAVSTADPLASVLNYGQYRGRYDRYDDDWRDDRRYRRGREYRDDRYRDERRGRDRDRVWRGPRRRVLLRAR